MNERIAQPFDNVISLKDRVGGDTKARRRVQVECFLGDHKKEIEEFPEYIQALLQQESRTYQAGDADDDISTFEEVFTELHTAVTTGDTKTLEALQKEYERQRERTSPQLGAQAMQDTVSLQRPSLRLIVSPSTDK